MQKLQNYKNQKQKTIICLKNLIKLDKCQIFKFNKKIKFNYN